MSNFIKTSIWVFLISATIIGCSYTPKQVEIANDVGQLLHTNKATFFQIIDTFQKIKSHSTDWELENLLKSGIQFQSNMPFETYGISFEDYKNKYYGNIDTTTTPCYVPDFELPLNFEDEIRQINVRTVRIIKDSLYQTKQIDFCFNSDKFPPITRTVILSYYPKNVPDSLKGNSTYIDEVNWTNYIDNKWILRSVGE